MGLRSTSLDQKPEVGRGELLYWSVYQALSQSRQHGFSGPQRITFSDMSALMDLRGIRSLDLREDVVSVVLALEDEYFSWVVEQQKAQARSNQRTSGRPEGAPVVEPVPPGPWSERNRWSPPFPGGA